MKKRLINFLTLAISMFLMGCSHSPTKELSNIEALKSQASTKISTARLENLKQTARGLASQASLAWRSHQLNLILKTQKRKLDHIFNFSHLILNSNVLPPVLVEGKYALNKADNYTLRLSDHEYQIVQPPHFITSPPNWRDYIWMAYKKPEPPNSTLLPQNAFERKTWNEYIKLGWNEGIVQADQIFAANLARLKRDYEGMILYRKLLAKNMVSPPYVSRANLGITGSGEHMHINDRVLRITAIPQLQTNPKNWRAVIPLKDKQQRGSLFNNHNNKKEKVY